nr:GNAT family N-acetyltransferase [Lachnospiraceae bacterium]
MSIWQDKATGAHIDELCKLSLKRQFEVRRLEYECREHDHTFSEADLTANRSFSKSFRCFYLYYDKGRLAGFLQLFAPTKDEAEITGFVDPILRGNGIFKRLLTYARLELDKYKIENAFFVLEPDSPDANSVAKHMNLENDRSELLMLLDGNKFDRWQEEYSAAAVLKIGNDRTFILKDEKNGRDSELRITTEYDINAQLISVKVSDDQAEDTP